METEQEDLCKEIEKTPKACPTINPSILFAFFGRGDDNREHGGKSYWKGGLGEMYC